MKTSLTTRPVLFPEHYAWYVLACALDLIVTNTVINHFGFVEANGLAAKVIELGGFWGLIGYKVLTMLVVLMVCEHVGTRRPVTGERLAATAVGLSAFPILAAGVQLGFLFVAGPFAA